jgi:hypothetical protein
VQRHVHVPVLRVLAAAQVSRALWRLALAAAQLTTVAWLAGVRPSHVLALL